MDSRRYLERALYRVRHLGRLGRLGQFGLVSVIATYC